MDSFNTLPAIRPISDLRTHLGEIEETARETGEPVILTRNGSPSLVVMDSESFDEHVRHERAVRALREAEIEESFKRESLSHDEVRSRAQLIIDAARKLSRAASLAGADDAEDVNHA